MRLTMTTWAAMVLFAVPVMAQEKPAEKDPAAEKITFQDHILPIFKAKCGACHSADSAKGGLVVDNYTGLMAGGASGEVVFAGDLDGSRLWELVSHKGKPEMPPNEPKLPDEQLNLIQKWIELGALEKSDSKAKIKKPSMSLGTAVISTGKPEGPPPMPENFPTDPLTVSSRGNAVTALATSPWAPLIAVAGHKQVLLYHTGELRLVGVLPFPEGQPHILKFSRNAGLLLAGGGRAGQSGRVIVWDVKTGQRVFEIGAEYDTVLAADISADHSQIALGGPRKVVRVYSTADGELMYEIKKHTDWITALEFSPDGVLLATGDRSNGLIVWEAFTGREFYVLNGHQAAINSLSWRADANVLASASEDGSIRLWEMTNGTQIKTWGAHGGGAAAVQFTRDSRLLSTGRDRVTKLWDQNGGQQRAFAALNDVGLEAAYSSEDERAFAGDWTGAVRVWNGADGAELPGLVTNPPALEARIQAATQAAQTAEAAAVAAATQLAAVQKTQADKEAAVPVALKAYTEAEAVAAQTATDKANADQALVEKTNLVAVRDEGFKTAAQGTVVATEAKAAAEKAIVDLGEGKATDADKALVTKAAELLQAATEAQTAAKTALDAAVTEKGTAEKLVADLTAKVKATADAAVALKVAHDKAVEVAKPTPEYQKALADAQAAAQTTAGAADKAKALVAQLTSEKGRAFATVPAPAEQAAAQ